MPAMAVVPALVSSYGFAEMLTHELSDNDIFVLIAKYGVEVSFGLIRHAELPCAARC